jgi:hypothetical protein
MFSANDIEQIKSRGANLNDIEEQIAYYKKGFPPLKLVKPATIGDGIITFDEKSRQEVLGFYDKISVQKTVLKFVPASGAASRMFKNLQEFRNANYPKKQAEELISAQTAFDSPGNFFKKLHHFSFFPSLKKVLESNGYDIKELLAAHEYNLIIDHFLFESGLNYSNLPKALLHFHKYEGFNRTSIEEHLVEAANYATATDRTANIHFTLSPEHISRFEHLIKAKLPEYEKKYKVKYKITFSIQDPATNTIAVDMNNEPFREKDGSIVFRPGGHGALLENMNKLDADVIFVKNIDNVVPEHRSDDTVTYKKLIGGHLLYLQQKVFDYLNKIESGKNETEFIAEISNFIDKELLIKLHAKYSENNKYTLEYFYQKLNRPIRVCGMVKNEGEPGGGPFWVKNADGSESLQIVESSQVDMNDPVQLNILKSSTHFNPVDLVCATKDYKNNPFPLPEYRDPETGFIAIKSKDGKDLKALELPGLWNGAMANWNTVFVEVPLSTFNPVKTINDLLREEHL